MVSHYQIAVIMIFPKTVITREFLSTVCGRVVLERNHFLESYASLQSTTLARLVHTFFLKWVNVKGEESKFHDAATQSWEVKIMLQRGLENMTVKVNQ